MLPDEVQFVVVARTMGELSLSLRSSSPENGEIVQKNLISSGDIVSGAKTKEKNLTVKKLYGTAQQQHVVD